LSTARSLPAFLALLSIRYTRDRQSYKYQHR